MDVEKLESVYEWVTALNLSKPIQNFAKDFSDAVLMAEIIAQFLPRYVTLANFGHVNSLALKRYNWETLQKVVLRHLKFQLTSEQIEKLANAEQGVIEWVLWEIKTRIQDAIKERRFWPANKTGRPSTSSRSASASREDLKEHYANRNSKVSSPSTSNSPFDKMGIKDLVQRHVYSMGLRPYWIKAYQRIGHLENQLKEKDRKIDELNQQIQKLLEIICRQEPKVFYINKTSFFKITQNSNTGKNTPMSISPRAACRNHTRSSASSMDLEAEFADFNFSYKN